MTDRTSRAVAPVSAVCAVFAAQPSAYPPSTRKSDVAPTCGSAAKATSAEEGCLRAAFGGEKSRKRQGRTKPRGRARPAAVTSARGADSFGPLRGRSKCREKQRKGVPKPKNPAVSRKNSGVPTKNEVIERVW